MGGVTGTRRINQLGRFLVLKGAWESVVDDDDTSWIDRWIEQTPPDRDRPFDGIAHSLRRMLAVGVDKQDINEVVRGMQAALLSNVCYLLDDPAIVEGNAYQAWRLFEIDDEGRPVQPISGLNESVLETGPTGREMRSRSDP